jgi:hypothetical protein
VSVLWAIGPEFDVAAVLQAFPERALGIYEREPPAPSGRLRWLERGQGARRGSGAGVDLATATFSG